MISQFFWRHSKFVDVYIICIFESFNFLQIHWSICDFYLEEYFKDIAGIINGFGS